MDLLVTLLVIVVAIAIVWWALKTVPIPEPFRWIVNVAIAIVALVILFEYVAPALHGVRLR